MTWMDQTKKRKAGAVARVQWEMLDMYTVDPGLIPSTPYSPSR